MIEVPGLIVTALVYALCARFAFVAIRDGQFTYYFGVLSEMVISRQRHPRTFWLMVAGDILLILVVTVALFRSWLGAN